MFAEFGNAQKAIKPSVKIARTKEYIMATKETMVAVEIGVKGGGKISVSIPAVPTGKMPFTELIYKAIDKLGTYYKNKKGEVSQHKTLHTTFSGLNGVIAKHYGFTDRNQVFAVYKHLLNIGAISSRPVFKGMLIGMPGAIKTTEDSETVTNKAMSAMGL